MKLDAYLSRSRHAVFYFRWPIPRLDKAEKRETLRLSLGTRCPKLAAELARHLATCGATVWRTGVPSNMRHDELRYAIRRYFQNCLAGFLDRIGADGPMSELQRAPLETSLSLAQATPDDFREYVMAEGTEVYLRRFCASCGLPQSEADLRPDRLQREIQIAQRDMFLEVQKHNASLERYDFKDVAVQHPVALTSPAALSPSITLAHAVDDYISENKRAESWQSGTFAKKLAALEALKELLGPNCSMSAINKVNSRDVKAVLTELPANVHKLPQTRNLTLRAATKVAGLTKLSTVSINGYISIYQSFFDWADKNGHVSPNPFIGMRVGASKGKAAEQRHAYSAPALTAVYRELTDNSHELVKLDSHKWATLIGMFSGARLKEICQMDTADVQQQDGIWFFNLTNEGDNTKRFKTAAAIRKVPVHTELLQLGLLDYRHKMQCLATSQMFPNYSYCSKNGYGRPLSRWFNEVLTPALSIKSKAHVFHGLRHTMVTRLAQAGVAEPIIQSIVGHERKGVTQQYLRDGYTLVQLKEAINYFTV